MASDTTGHDDEYGDDLIALLELIWGDGFLSPGGPEAVAAIIADNDLAGRRVLDIGCGLGGIDVLLAREYGAQVVGIDVEQELVRLARERVARERLDDRIEIVRVDPGPLPFADASFDVVFSKDAWIHIEDKPAMFADLHRVLRPGGLLLAGDWMRGPEPFSREMEYFFELEGLTYHMATLDDTAAMLVAAGFDVADTQDITAEYRAQAHVEHDQMRGPLAERIEQRLGAETAVHFVENWRQLTVVLDRGELRPGRLRARKPPIAS